MRDSWTDGRLDDLSDRMDRGFEHAAGERREIRAEMDRRFEQAAGERRELRAEMDHRFAQAAGERKEIRVEMREHHVAIERRFDSLQQTMILAAAGVIAALIGLIATQL